MRRYPHAFPSPRSSRGEGDDGVRAKQSTPSWVRGSHSQMMMTCHARGLTPPLYRSSGRNVGEGTPSAHIGVGCIGGARRSRGVTTSTAGRRLLM